MGKISDLIGLTQGQPSSGGVPSGGGKIAALLSTVNNNPTVSANPPAVQKQQQAPTQPSLIQKVGDFIISQVPRLQADPLIAQAQTPLPTLRPISITPNQKRIAPSQLTQINREAGQSAVMKAVNPSTGSLESRMSPRTASGGTLAKVKSAFESGIESTKGNIKNTAALLVSKLREEGVKNESEFQKLAKKNPEIYSTQFFEERKKNIQGLSNAAEKIRQSAQANFDKSQEIRTKNIPVDNRKLLDKARDPAWLAISVAENLPNMLTSLGISVATLAVTKNPYAAVVTGFAGSFSQEAGGAYQDAKEFGADKETAEKVAVQVGVGAGLLEILPIAKLLDRSPQGEAIKKQMIKQITKKILIQTTLEAGTESLQEIVANTVAQTYDKNRDFFQGVGESAIIGAIMGGGSEVGGTAFDEVTKKIGQESPEATVPIEKQIAGLLPENINHNPQAVINAVIKGGLDKTPEGKTLMKSALEAQQKGTDLVISQKTEAPTAPRGREITPQDKVIMEQIKTLEPIAKADMQKAQAEADMRSAATQDMGLLPKDRQDFARLGALIKNAEDKGMIDVQSLKKTSSTLLNWGLERWREIKPQTAQMTDDEILLEIQDFTSQNSFAKRSKVEKPASVTLLEEMKKSVKDIANENQKEISRTLDQAYQEAGVDPTTGKVDKKTDALDYLNKKSSDTVKFRTIDQGALDAQAYTDHARTLIERRKNLKQEHPEWLDTNDILTQNEKAINVALDLAAKARASTPKYRVAKEIKTVKDAKDLFVLHNLSPSGIDKAFAEGGIPAPSLAVTKKDNSFSDFGEVTLIGDKNLIDPTKKDVTVYSGDIYTTRTPRPEYTANNVYNTDLGNELEKKGIYFGDFDSISPSQALNRLISPRISENAYSLAEAEKIISQIYSDPYITLKSAEPSPIVKSVIQTIPSLSKLIRDSQSAYDLEMQIDNDQMIYERLTQLANKNKEDISDLVGNIVSGVYTRNPYTAENKVARAKELVGRNKDEFRGTEQGWGAGASPRIFGYKKLLSIEDIRANKDILTTKEKATQIGALREENLYNFLLKRSYSVDTFSNGDLFKEIVSREKYNDGKFIQDYLSNFDGFKKLSLIDATQIGILIKKAYVNAPTDYFESKIMRVVGLKEFKGALVSQDTLPETIKKLQDSGLKVVKYDPAIEGDRLKKLQDNFSTELFRVKDDVKSFTGKTITDAQEQEIIDLNKKIFGDDNVKITLQIMANEKALGQYYDNMIQVVEGQANPTDTYLHEAVHKYLDVFSTKEEYAGALVEGQKKYKLDDFAQVEEKIAEDFIRFAKDQSTFTGKIKAFFSDILRRIKAYFGNKSEIDTLYNDIISGKAATKTEVQQGAVAELSKIPTNTDAQTPAGAGDLKKSKAYTRVIDLIKEEFQQDVSYNVLNLEKDAKNAVDFIAKDPKAAIRVGLGLEQPPEGQTETAISIALAEKAATEGDYALQSRLESSRSLRQTRRGQEIVSERGRFEDDSPHKYMRELLNTRLSNLGANVKDALAEVVNRGRSMKEAAMEKIDTEAKKIKESIRKDRKKIQMAQDIINSLICK